MVEFRSNSLWKMGDNELYSRISPIANECRRFLVLFVGVLSGRFGTLGLACVLMSRPISPELVLSPDF